jgi:hypothetical protein
VPPYERPNRLPSARPSTDGFKRHWLSPGSVRAFLIARPNARPAFAYQARITIGSVVWRGAYWGFAFPPTLAPPCSPSAGHFLLPARPVCPPACPVLFLGSEFSAGSSRHRTSPAAAPAPKGPPAPSQPLISFAEAERRAGQRTEMFAFGGNGVHRKSLPHVGLFQSISVWLSNENPIGNLMGAASRIAAMRIKRNRFEQGRALC